MHCKAPNDSFSSSYGFCCTVRPTANSIRITYLKLSYGRVQSIVSGNCLDDSINIEKRERESAKNGYNSEANVSFELQYISPYSYLLVLFQYFAEA